MLNCGDAADRTKVSGRPTFEQKKQIDCETKKAIEMIALGKTVGEAARSQNIRHNTLSQRLHSRGLNVQKIRKGAQ